MTHELPKESKLFFIRCSNIVGWAL